MEEGRVERCHGYDLRFARHQENASSQVSRISESPAHVADNIKEGGTNLSQKMREVEVV